MSSWLLWRAQLAEPEITAALQDVSAGTDIGRQQWELKGLEYRFKDHGSLTRKILSKSADDAVSLEEAAHGIGDVLRYTLVSTDETGYAGAVPQALTFLTQRGFRVTKFHNAWGGKFYQGINVKLVSPVGQVVPALHTGGKGRGRAPEPRVQRDGAGAARCGRRAVADGRLAGMACICRRTGGRLALLRQGSQ